MRYVEQSLNTILNKIVNRIKGLEINKTDHFRLYHIQVTQEEFIEIKDLLQKFYVEHYQLSKKPIYKKQVYCALFVLYASEWWKREYEGGHWGFEPIFESLILSKDSFPVYARNYMIKMGFAFWGLAIDSNGKKYIGTIVANGGIPFKLIKKEGRGLKKLINKVVKLAIDNIYTDNHISQIIETKYKLDLPYAYRKYEFYLLFATIVNRALSLKEKYSLSNKVTAIKTLNSHYPNWRNEFPISLDYPDAIRFIEEIVSDSVEFVKSTKKAIQLQQTLDYSIVDQSFRIKTEVDLTDEFNYEELQRLFGINASEEKAITSNIIFKSEFDIEHTIPLLLKFGKNIYKCNQTQLQYEGITKAIFLRDNNGSIWNLLNTSIFIDDDEPLVFSDDDEMQFLFSGSGRTKHDSVLLVSSLPVLDVPKESLIGKVEHLRKYIYKLNENTNYSRVSEFGGVQQYKIIVSTVLQDNEITWSGTLINDLFETQKPVYRGYPRLYIDSNQSSVKWTLNGGISANGIVYGQLNAHYDYDKIVSRRKTFIVIPDISKEYAIVDSIKKQTSWVLKDWPILINSVKSLDDSFLVEIEYSKNEVKLFISYIGASQVKGYALVELLFKYNPIPIKLRLPFYLTQINILDSTNYPIPSNSKLDVNDIYGFSIQGFKPDKDNVSLKIDPNVNGNLAIKIKTTNNSTFSLRLNDFKEQIISAQESLMYKLIDHYERIEDVRLSIRVNDKNKAILLFPIYTFEVYFDDVSSGMKLKSLLKNETIQQTNASIRISPIDLSEEPVTFNLDKNSTITLKDLFLESDSLFVYPEKESLIQFRPLIVNRTKTREEEFESDRAKLGEEELIAINKFESKSSVLGNALTEYIFNNNKLLLNSFYEEILQDLQSPNFEELIDYLIEFGHLNWKELPVIKELLKNPELLLILLLKADHKSDYIFSFVTKLINTDDRFTFKISVAIWLRVYEKIFTYYISIHLSKELAILFLNTQMIKIIELNHINLIHGIVCTLFKKSHDLNNEQLFKTMNCLQEVGIELYESINIFQSQAESAYQKLYNSFLSHSFVTIRREEIPELLVWLKSKSSSLNELIEPRMEFNYHLKPIIKAPLVIGQLLLDEEIIDLNTKQLSQLKLIKDTYPDWYRSAMIYVIHKNLNK